MSTPCSQSLRPNRLVVSEYEVPNVLVAQKWGVYSETPCIMMPFCALRNPCLQPRRTVVFVRMFWSKYRVRSPTDAMAAAGGGGPNQTLPYYTHTVTHHTNYFH